MNKLLFHAAGLAGLLTIGWVASGYLHSSPLAGAMTLLIGAFYGLGALELWRFQQATAGLNRALGGLATGPAQLDALGDWLTQVPPSLRHTVRLRVEGTRTGLPGPALAPYLVGLLVLLGMLGTFVGMVLTLQGTGLSLERAIDVQTLRDSLAAPVRGLGLAFGTSVAGVAASAMLGLMVALCRRDRQQAGQLLDTHSATTLQAFSLSHQAEQRRIFDRESSLRLRQQTREEAVGLAQQRHQENLQLQQQQVQQLPLLVNHLQGLMLQMEQRAQQSNEQLLASQQQFQGQAQQAYSALAQSVGQTLQRSLEEGARITTATLEPAVAATMKGMAQETAALQRTVANTLQQQLQGFAQGFEAQSSAWLDTLGHQAQAQSAAWLQTLDLARAEQQVQHLTRDEQHLAAWGAALAGMAAQLEQTSGHITEQVEAQARSTITEVASLVQAATAAPRAAAEVVAQLREQLSASLARDNTLLEERGRLMASLNTLLGMVQHSTAEQQTAVKQMLVTTSTGLQQAQAHFTAQVNADAARLETASAQLTSSAVEVASLGEAFGVAVNLFQEANLQMVCQMKGLEEALGKASARGDEQLAYYVAQAREVIDLSLLSQKQVVDELQRLAKRQVTMAGAVA